MIYEESAECADCSQNPEYLMLRAEDEDEDSSVLESFWLAGNAVTHPQLNKEY